MEVTLESVQQKCYESATLFNKIARGGKGIDDFSQKELYDVIYQQYLIAKEEVEETLKAISEDDVVEELDGYIDSFFTTLPFFEMLIRYSKLNGNFDIFEPFDLGFSYRKLCNTFTKSLPFKEFDIKLLNKASDLIIENNQQKFTTNLEEFNAWKSEHTRTSVEVDGIVYYYLVDGNMKVKKHDNFKNVDLGVLFNNAKEK